jgi:sugar (pentulose or hexulose) kinase
MERIARDMARKMDALDAAGLKARRVFMVGGPSESPVWPDMLREATGCDITLPENGAYAGAIGAAKMAGTGYFEAIKRSQV